MPIIVRAHELALHSKRGPVYGPVSFLADSGLTVLTGPAGSGRTSLLLTLAGRMKPSGGHLETLGYELPRRARPVQVATAIAGFQGIDTLEESVTVGAAIRERAAWLSPWWAFVRRTDEAELRRVLAPVFGEVALPGVDTLIWDLDEVQAVLLRIALAMMSEPDVLFFDQIEQLQAPEARLVLWHRLDAISRAGTAVVASAAAPELELWAELGLTPHVVDLAAPQGEASAAPRDDASDLTDLILEHA
ncbi:ATP-binding cassette domain-containing protein [Agromyces sp. NPDC058104]|uniref:ATP-binding cassette domain-containing protein n=1 Tax=Agromyces sp. NPDC058104 TaxID=3346342 RepID=UPI0036DBC0B5